MRTADSMRFGPGRPALPGSPAGEPSLWHDATQALVEPASRRLGVLAAHVTPAPPTWLDRVGGEVAARLHGLRRPASRLQRRARRIHQQAHALRPLDDAALQDHLHRHAAGLRLKGADHADAAMLHEQALAAVGVAVERVHGFMPHVVQFMGALGLLEGHMVEMATGEGKTVTAAMAAVVCAWRGEPCHVVTANDYLARRDAELGERLFARCGLSVASVHGGLPPEARGAAYRHDVVYTTAQDLLADHLRDRLALGKTPSPSRFSLGRARQGGASAGVAGGDGTVLRGLAQVIVDEADSVLIDEAVTPLIISTQRPDDLLDQAAGEAVALARQLVAGEDYQVQAALRHARLNDAGRHKLQSLTASLSPFWRHPERSTELVEMALYAREFLVRDLHYVIEDGKVVLVDELTGRLASQRTLSLGMQQVLEASEGLAMSPPSEVSARLSFQRFFQLFPRLGGMTGTAEEAQDEFAAVYGLSTLAVPTHRVLRRRFRPVRLCADEAAKFDAIARSAVAECAQGRAVLIGMRSVRSSEALREHFRQHHPQHAVEVLHAVHHEQESAIVARAGQPGAITIATNMAGRGTDIALHDTVREAGGLHVIVGEGNDFRRIDRQLAGRCARQGDPGSVQRFVAFDDELNVRFTSAGLLRLWRLLHRSVPPLDGLVTRAVLWLTQRRAERLAFHQRQASLRHDLDLDKTGL